MAKKYARVNPKDCVACGACTKVCPKQVIKVIKGVFARVQENSCLGCGKCSKVCPASAIELKVRELV
ncbi:4Fe-4S dicluster domain-containing protein [Treponema pectinovorum]|uniref:4Fe-4S dicluster domain-containing protein n=1 Tax=Treponema pectinovorum TaxID=164 RepID=UPI003D8E7468